MSDEKTEPAPTQTWMACERPGCHHDITTDHEDGSGRCVRAGCACEAALVRSDWPGRQGNACYGCTRADLAALIEVVQAIHSTYELNCAPRSKTVLAEARETMARLAEKYGSKP